MERFGDTVLRWWERVKGERTFRKGSLQVKARVIKRPLPNRWLALVMSSELVLLEPNWPIIAAESGEINENSSHPLTLFLRQAGFTAFSIYPDSIFLEPEVSQKPLKVAKRMAKLLFLWERNKPLRAAWLTIFIFGLQNRHFDNQ